MRSKEAKRLTGSINGSIDTIIYHPASTNFDLRDLLSEMKYNLSFLYIASQIIPAFYFEKNYQLYLKNYSNLVLMFITRFFY